MDRSDSAKKTPVHVVNARTKFLSKCFLYVSGLILYKIRVITRKIIRKIDKLFFRNTHQVLFNDLRRPGPIGRVYGSDRGKPIDRHYIEHFMSENRSAITGSVLEIADHTYTEKFGTNVTNARALMYGKEEPVRSTFYGDLTDKTTLPKEEFDCFICTQTLNFIFDFDKAIEGAAYLLKPGGVFLGTTAGISQIIRYDMDHWGEYWRFTDLSMKMILKKHFKNVEIKTYGNALSCTAFLQGICVQDLPQDELLDKHDPDYQMIIAFSAIK
jgi:hypothetical protein